MINSIENLQYVCNLLNCYKAPEVHYSSDIFLLFSPPNYVVSVVSIKLDVCRALVKAMHKDILLPSHNYVFGWIVIKYFYFRFYIFIYIFIPYIIVPSLLLHILTHFIINKVLLWIFLFKIFYVTRNENITLFVCHICNITIRDTK